MALDKIYIPTFISSVNYDPTRVLPHVYFYNGMKNTNTYFVEYLNSGSVATAGLSAFPYFDNYQGNNPTTSSRTLLFNNETAPYGEMPSQSLYSEYWEKYVTLLYSPTTRIFDCEAIIPLADYFKMELNDIVEWRGNYYHLRAINDYNLANGECNLQLLGPVLTDVISNILPVNDCNFNFSVSAASPIILYSYQRGNGYANPGFTYVDFNGILRAQETFTFGNSFRFAAISGSVTDVIGGGTLSVLTNPFNVEFNNVTVTKTAGPGLTAYTGQNSDGQTGFYSDGTGAFTRTYCWVSSSANETWDPLNKLTITNGATCTPSTPTNISTIITITLTEKIKKAGPDFEVYYSDDCNNYTYLQTIQLANIGDAVNVTVPNTSSCIKLVSLGDCGNSVVHVIPGALGGDFNIDFSSLDFNVF